MQGKTSGLQTGSTLTVEDPSTTKPVETPSQYAIGGYKMLTDEQHAMNMKAYKKFLDDYNRKIELDVPHDVEGSEEDYDEMLEKMGVVPLDTSLLVKPHEQFDSLVVKPTHIRPTFEWETAHQSSLSQEATGHGIKGSGIHKLLHRQYVEHEKKTAKARDFKNVTGAGINHMVDNVVRHTSLVSDLMQRHQQMHLLAKHAKENVEDDDIGKGIGMFMTHNNYWAHLKPAATNKVYVGEGVNETCQHCGSNTNLLQHHTTKEVICKNCIEGKGITKKRQIVTPDDENMETYEPNKEVYLVHGEGPDMTWERFAHSVPITMNPTSIVDKYSQPGLVIEPAEKQQSNVEFSNMIILTGYVVHKYGQEHTSANVNVMANLQAMLLNFAKTHGVTNVPNDDYSINWKTFDTFKSLKNEFIKHPEMSMGLDLNFKN